MKNLTLSQNRYIKAVYELSSGCENGVRGCDVAKMLRLSKASVSLAIKKLAKMGLVRLDAAHHIYLTKDGECAVVQRLNKLEIIRKFFVVNLGIDKELAIRDACAIEHVISMDALCAMCRSYNSSKMNGKCEDNCPISRNPS